MLNVFPWKDLHRVRDMVDLMYDTSVEIYQGKKRALQQGDHAVAQQLAEGKDIMSLLSAYIWPYVQG